MIADKPETPPEGRGKLAIGDKEFERLSQAVYRESGIVLSARKKELIVSRLSMRLRALAMDDFAPCCDLIERHDAHRECVEMLHCLTTNVTRFFREPHHFPAFPDAVLPGLIADMRSGRRIRFWCAGCSSGEEPYSMAMCFRQAVPDVERHDVRILATDIDTRVLQVARAGEYPNRAVEDVSAEFLPCFTRHSEKCGEAIRTKMSVRNLVHFAGLNLNRPWPMKGRFDAIFCRNGASVSMRRPCSGLGGALLTC